MSLSILQDDELVEALGYATTWAPSWASNDHVEIAQSGADAKRAWRAVPAHWQHELEQARARRGQRSREEHLAEVRARSAAGAEQRAERARERKREYGKRPEVRDRGRARQRARRAAMPRDELRARWRLDTQAYRERKRLARERGAS